MHIYFTASIVGKRKFLSQYASIIHELRSHGHSVMANHILETSEEQIRFETPEERRSFHKKLEKWISEADCMIVEASFPSISVGYEISMALNKGKPVLVLYTDGDPPSLLPELNTERLIVEKYDSSCLSSILHDFLLYASGTHETRFTFFLSHQQAFHLASAAKLVGIPKSAYLRNLIDDDSRKSR